MKQQNNKRQLILDTALDIIEAEGMRALTQPKLAKASGIRQSHLTYYFPRKADLYIALLDASHERAERTIDRTDVALEDMLATLLFEPERMRFFVSILLEVGDDPELQSILREHAEGLCTEIAARVGKAADDTRIRSFVDELRGLGLRALMSPQLPQARIDLIKEAAERHGLALPQRY